MKHLHEKSELMQDELIICTGLPGHRRITRENCGRRYLLAREKAQEFSKAVLDIGKMSSLEICCTCPEGSINAKRFMHELFDHADCHDDSEKHKKKS